MKLGRLLLRTTIGAVFVTHGSQKLFGAFEGHGLEGTGQFFESLGLRPGRLHAAAAGATELGSGLLLAVGLATPVAAAGISGVMITALRTTAWADGPKPATGELEVLLTVGALAIADEGPGPLSLEAALGRDFHGTFWALAALAAGACGSALVMAARRDEAR